MCLKDGQLFQCQSCLLYFHHTCCTIDQKTANLANNDNSSTAELNQTHVGNVCSLCNQTRLLCESVTHGDLLAIERHVSLGVASPFQWWNTITKRTPLHINAGTNGTFSTSLSVVIFNIMMQPYVVEGSEWQLSDKKIGKLRIKQTIPNVLFHSVDARGLTIKDVALQFNNYTFHHQFLLSQKVDAFFERSLTFPGSWPNRQDH